MRSTACVVLSLLGLLVTSSTASAADCPAAARALSELVAQPPTADAEEKMRAVIEQCADLAEAHFHLGSVLSREGKNAEALKSFQKAAELKRDTMFLVAVGNTQFRLDNLKGAEQAYEEALKLNTSSAKAMQGLSVIYLRQGKRAEAEEVLRRAIQVTPEDPGLFYNLGVLLVQSGRTEEAVESFRAASERRSPYPEAQLQLASLELQLGNYDSAEKLFRQVSLLDPKNPTVWLGLGSALDGKKDYPAALAQFEKVLSLEPGNVSAKLNHGIVQVKAGKTEEGTNELRALSESEPKNGAVFGALGWSLLQEKEYDRAREALENAVRLDPKNAFAYNNLGVLFQLRGDGDKAREAFERARELSPSLEEAGANLSALNEE